MNKSKILFGLVVAVLLGAWLFSKKIFAVIILAVVQYYAKEAFARITFDIPGTDVPIINFDKEVSNLIIALSSFYYGAISGVFILGLSQVIHFFHREKIDFILIIDLWTKGFLIIGLISILRKSPLYSAVIISIMITKVLNIFMQKLLVGKRIFAPLNISDMISIVVYYGVYNVFSIIY
ncbi:MAG: hypothetical protein KKF44_04475 [Nanoarchaeota archaeon]|nr:hypothetical protein [Nanoarchaeota archaeon]